MSEKEKCLLQPVVTAEMNVKYHSSQKKTGLFIAENVSKITNQQKVEEILDLVEDPFMIEMTETIEVQDLVEDQGMKDQERCLMQPVATVEMNVKYHSSQKKTDLFIAENVSKITNQQKIEEILDRVEDPFMIEMTETIEVQDLVEDQEMKDQERCLMQPVATVEMNVKYHSSQKKTDLFIAENVSKNTNNSIFP